MESVAVDGAKIRRLRENAMFGRRELAELAGINPHTLYRIETGKLNTSRPTLRRISTALRVSPLALLEDEVLV